MAQRTHLLTFMHFSQVQKTFLFFFSKGAKRKISQMGGSKIVKYTKAHLLHPTGLCDPVGDPELIPAKESVFGHEKYSKRIRVQRN